MATTKFKSGDLLIDPEGNTWRLIGFMGEDQDFYLLQNEHVVNDFYDKFDVINMAHHRVDADWRLDLTEVNADLIKDFLEDESEED